MDRLLELLEQARDVLQPFTLQIGPSTLVYDGRHYSPTPPHECDPYALAWWSSFQTMIALLTGLDTITKSQFTYLRNFLCGGMGSFNDFSLDQQQWGESAAKANRELNKIRSSLDHALHQIRVNVS